jgi:hypothetical protein
MVRFLLFCCIGNDDDGFSLLVDYDSIEILIAMTTLKQIQEEEEVAEE